ncbi:MAG: hypothetical protein ABR612_01575 [Chromatocurvus sp.]
MALDADQLMRALVELKEGSERLQSLMQASLTIAGMTEGGALRAR